MSILDIYFSKGVSLQQAVLTEILAANQRSSQYGLVLTAKDAAIIIDARDQALVSHGRVETGIGVITKIIDAFCSSPFIDQGEYVQTITGLVETFYVTKNETEDQIDDDELINTMAEYFNNSCQGSLDLLRDRELVEFTRQFINSLIMPGNEE